MPVLAPVTGFSALAAGAGVLEVAGGGLLAWSPLESLMHRLFFHAAPVPPSRVHPRTAHPGDPEDRARIAAPLWLGLPIAGLARLALGSWERTSLGMAGLFMGYVACAIHTAARPGPLLRRWRAYPFTHHFQDERRAFGVTPPLWDALLFTLPRKGP